MDDELHRVRELFYAGFYQMSLDLGKVVKPSNESVAIERDTIVSRCKLALNCLDSHEANDMRNNPEPALCSVGFFAMHKYAQSDEIRRAALEGLRNASKSHDTTARILTACALGSDDNVSDALEYTRDGPLELQALRTQLLLKIDRLDLAQKHLQEMSAINDDAGVTNFCGAVVNIALGNYQESYLSCGDIQSQCCAEIDPEGRASTILLNVKAVANMARREWSEAYEDLQRAYHQNPGDLDTIVNLICCCRNMRRDEECDQYFAQLRNISPRHPYVVKTDQLEGAFDKFQQSLHVTAH